jgi:hypothetical protein
MKGPKRYEAQGGNRLSRVGQELYVLDLIIIGYCSNPRSRKSK